MSAAACCALPPPSPLPDGRWLLRRRGRRYVLPPDLGARLADGDGASFLARVLDRHEAAGASGRGRRAPPWPRLTLLPPRVVDAVARRLAPLAVPGMLAGSALAGLALMAAAWCAPTAGAVVPGAVAALVAVLLAHELGHAAALRREGGRPGAVGIGWLVVTPSLWCDVTEVALLPRWSRVRVALAGAAWQLGLGGATAVVALLAGSPTAALTVRFVGTAAAWSLLPLLRTDGARALADAVGIDEPTSPSPPDASRRHRCVAAAGRLLMALCVGGVSVMAPWRIVPRLGFLWSGPLLADAIAAAALFVVVGGIWFVAARRIVALIRAVAGDLRGPEPGPV